MYNNTVVPNCFQAPLAPTTETIEF
jgi:hypothetical protein